MFKKLKEKTIEDPGKSKKTQEKKDGQSGGVSVVTTSTKEGSPPTGKREQSPGVGGKQSRIPVSMGSLKQKKQHGQPTGQTESTSSQGDLMSFDSPTNPESSPLVKEGGKEGDMLIDITEPSTETSSPGPAQPHEPTSQQTLVDGGDSGSLGTQSDLPIDSPSAPPTASHTAPPTSLPTTQGTPDKGTTEQSSRGSLDDIKGEEEKSSWGPPDDNKGEEETSGGQEVDEPASPGVTQILDSTRHFGSRMFGMFRTRWQQGGDPASEEKKDNRSDPTTPSKVLSTVHQMTTTVVHHSIPPCTTPPQ
jgi:hypothetical protein